MPQANKRLRDKFMADGSDGIANAESILLQSGWAISLGLLVIDGVFDDPEKYSKEDQIDARDFLIDEWDYALFS